MSQIYGIGNDICDIRRIRAAFERHGERFAQKVLSEAEMQTFRAASVGQTVGFGFWPPVFRLKNLSAKPLA